jgi:hypothetical protein
MARNDDVLMAFENSTAADASPPWAKLMQRRHIGMKPGIYAWHWNHIPMAIAYSGKIEIFDAADAGTFDHSQAWDISDAARIRRSRSAADPTRA